MLIWLAILGHGHIGLSKSRYRSFSKYELLDFVKLLDFESYKEDQSADFELV